MKMRRALTTSFAALAAGGLMAITASSPASAAEPPGGIVWDHVYTASGVKVNVEEHGDYVSVCDTSANGYAARVEIRKEVLNGSVYVYDLTASGGSGSCVTKAASDGGWYDLEEGIYYTAKYSGDNWNSSESSTWLNDN